MTSPSQTVLVTGGAGFIGSNVVTALLEDGYDIHVVDNLFAGTEALLPEEATFHEVDIRADALATVAADIDPETIIHLAAIHYIPYCNANPEDAFEVNVIGTRNLLDAARDLESLETVIFASSAAVYPPSTGPTHETDPVGPMDIYGQTKLIGEDLLRLFERDTGVPTAVARLFNVYGPAETNDHLIPAVISQVRNGSREIALGNLEPQRDFVHVSDVARALRLIMREYDNSFRVYNVGTGTERSVREVVEATSLALGEEIDIRQDPERVRESDRLHLQADPSRLQTEFDWEPRVSFIDGLQDLLDETTVLEASQT